LLFSPEEYIILVSGYVNPELKSEFLNAVIVHFLYKQYDLAHVLTLGLEVLDEKRKQNDRISEFKEI